MKVSRIGVAPHSPTPAGRDATVSTSPRQRMRTVFVPHRQNRRASNAPLSPAQTPHRHPERCFALYIGRESFSPKKGLRLTIQRDSLSRERKPQKEAARSRTATPFRESLLLPCFPCASLPFELGLYSRKHGKIGFKVCPPAFLASFPHGGLSVAFPGAASSVRSIPNVSPRLEGTRQG